jgi:virginiamycin B lyase
MNARSILVRRIALALVTLAVAVLAFAASADAFVYWTNDTDPGSIGRANHTDGGGVNQNFITGARLPIGVAVDATHIYWTNTAAGMNTIGRASLPNGDGANQSFVTGPIIPGGLAVDAAHIYWTNIGGNSLGSASVSDGSGVNNNFGSLSPLVLPLGMAVDSTYLYWTFLGVIGRYDLTNGTAQRVFIQPPPGNDDIEGMAVDSSHIYWTDDTTNTIGRADLDGTSASVDPSFITGASSPKGIAVDGSHIYWANSGTSSIGRADIDPNGDVSNITPGFIPGANSPFGVAVDSLTSPGPGPPPPPPPPPPTIQDLIDEVAGNDELSAGIKRSLLAKLEGAQRKLDAKHLQGACGSLGAYINEVKAQDGKELETAYAEALVLDAIAVRASLGCSSS